MSAKVRRLLFKVKSANLDMQKLGAYGVYDK